MWSSKGMDGWMLYILILKSLRQGFTYKTNVEIGKYRRTKRQIIKLVGRLFEGQTNENDNQ